MLLAFARRSRPRPQAKVPPAAEPSLDYQSVVSNMAIQATGLACEAAEMCGSIDDAASDARSELVAFETLSAEINSMIESNSAIAASVESSQQSASAARAAVERVAADVTGALASLHEVAQVADEITRIALQTRLVAFNAAVEAKHAGAAGRGFAVVAEAVKDLAQKVESSSKAIGRTMQQLDERIGELAHNIRESDVLADGSPTFHRAFVNVVEAGTAIAAVTDRNQQSCNATRASLAHLHGQVLETKRTLESSRQRTEVFLTGSECLIQMAADCGASTADSPFIAKAIATAAQVCAAFEQAFAQGQISLDELFDTRYQAVAGTQPQQHLTRYVSFTDRVLPPIQEPVLEFSDKIVFCAAVDRNGYLPTHNRKFSNVPRADPVWNAAHCRNRRIFNDRTGLAAGQNLHGFLLQTYRRDMGGRNFKLMKDVSAPISVQGRHWGGLRIAYAY
ncbi:Methyl-accepting chemotaxis sensory transducer [Burkholderiales bacterium]|nr:Methyl-accepting chemotaxis sensory transducer [Burkholderiales bacterium]